MKPLTRILGTGALILGGLLSCDGSCCNNYNNVLDIEEYVKETNERNFDRAYKIEEMLENVRVHKKGSNTEEDDSYWPISPLNPLHPSSPLNPTNPVSPFYPYSSKSFN